MKIQAKVIADSISPAGKRLTTLELQYPRFIHSELMTHRVMSRSAASSRAIPVARMLEQVRSDPAMPVHWGRNQPGMQAKEELDGVFLDLAKHTWLLAAESSAMFAENLAFLGLHKQIANRLLEPFQWMRTLMTATEWDNFFELRAHPDAQPEIQALAFAMRDAMQGSQPTLCEGWHLPYITNDDRARIEVELLPRVSAARCARVSYLKHDGSAPDIDSDLHLFGRLVGSRPLHASPLEHAARPLHDPNEHSRNFVGWEQYRAIYEESLKC